MRRTFSFCLLALCIGSAAWLTSARGRQASDVKQAELAEAARLSQEVVKLYAAQKYTEAIPLAERALALKEKQLGADDPTLTSALYNLAALYQATDKGDKAEPLFVRALALYDKTPSADTAPTENALSKLGVLYYRRGKYDRALESLERAVALREKRLGAEHEELAPFLADLSEAYIAVHKLDKALDILQRAIHIWAQHYEAHSKELGRAQDRSACLSAFSGRAPSAKPPDPSASRLMVELGVLNGKALSKPPPAYPIAAKQARAMGPVVVKIVVDEQGKVVKAQSICGHQLLTAAAEDAAREARFTPTLLKGQPVKVSGYITYNFVLR